MQSSIPISLLDPLPSELSPIVSSSLLQVFNVALLGSPGSGQTTLLSLVGDSMEYKTNYGLVRIHVDYMPEFKSNDPIHGFILLLNPFNPLLYTSSTNTSSSTCFHTPMELSLLKFDLIGKIYKQPFVCNMLTVISKADNPLVGYKKHKDYDTLSISLTNNLKENMAVLFERSLSLIKPGLKFIMC
ncbi:MAG: hypothetical protein Sylvanvirus12_2 [Sylvanvirus sp.]|uniref:Uncharacterized protein n=1 Tax=Sylvanvirus sp. TaxID=2487774 RepID=A0A3G5AI68_9VIRU|nr:MAG: hypothetical protein Sylvanvirus12_2 [Sylvanvirus sp.]